MSDTIRETLEPPAPADPSDFQTLQGIALDMVESLRPIVLPEILGVLRRAIKQAHAPAPAADGERDHVPGAGNMVPAAYAARLRQCPTHGQLPANAWGCPECLRELREELARLRARAADGEREELASALEVTGSYEIPSYEQLRRAAALLRQLPPEGLEAIQYWAGDDGAVIQRTLRAPESWAIRAGSACMSTTGEWDIEPMPSDRTDEWLANHRWPSAAAAWAALRQSRGAGGGR